MSEQENSAGKMHTYLSRSNVKLVSDGTIFGTQVVFIHEDGREEPIVPVVGARWVLDVREGILQPVLTIVIEMAQLDIVTPAGIVEFVGVKSREEAREIIREIMSDERLKGSNHDQQG